jgi:hypothetical protein
MAEEMNMMGEQPPVESQMQLQGDIPPEAQQNLMSADPDIQAVLLSRISQMTPDELTTLDNAISPEVTRALLKLLPELQEIITMVNQQKNEMPTEAMAEPMPENVDTAGMPKEMGALGNV